MSSSHASRSVIVVMTMVGLTLACSAHDLAAPNARRLDGASSRSADVLPRDAWSEDGASRDAKPQPVHCAVRAPVIGSGTFGPRGGLLRIGGSALVIPGGALRDTVTITGTSLGDASSTIDFQPHGLRFVKHAALVLSGEGCALPTDAEPSVVYLGSDGRVIETIAALYLPRYKLVAAPIDHFSGYAIAF